MIVCIRKVLEHIHKVLVIKSYKSLKQLQLNAIKVGNITEVRVIFCKRMGK